MAVTALLAGRASADTLPFEEPQDMTAAATPELAGTADTAHAFAGVQHLIDDNVFRLPSPAVFVLPPASSVLSRADHLDIYSVGASGQRSWNTQTLELNAQVDENRYVLNSAFNGVTGKAGVQLDWSAGPLLTGQAGVRFNRFISAFQDTLFYNPNFFNVLEYFGKVRFQTGPHWLATGGLSRARDSSSNEQLSSNDFLNTSGNLSLHYFTLAEDWIGWDYLYNHASFNTPGLLNQLLYNRDYHENSGRLSTQYAFSSKWLLNANVGYLDHDTPGVSFGTFSGDVWRATLRWQPLTKTQFTLSGWRDITAYLDAQSAFFVSTGYSITPTWTPRDKLSLAIIASHERHVFLGTGSSTLQPLADFLSRRDELSIEQIALTYRPRTPVTLKVTYGYQHRTSTIAEYSYNDNMVNINLQVTY